MVKTFQSVLLGPNVTPPSFLKNGDSRIVPHGTVKEAPQGGPVSKRTPLPARYLYARGERTPINVSEKYKKPKRGWQQSRSILAFGISTSCARQSSPKLVRSALKRPDFSGQNLLHIWMGAPAAESCLSVLPQRIKDTTIKYYTTMLERLNRV